MVFRGYLSPAKKGLNGVNGGGGVWEGVAGDSVGVIALATWLSD